MTIKDKGDQKELQKYLSEWQKRHQEYLEKKSQEASEEKENQEIDDEIVETSESLESDQSTSREDEKVEENDQVSDEHSEEFTDQSFGESGEDGDESSADDESLVEEVEDESDLSETRKLDKPRIARIHLYRAVPVLVISSLLILLSLYFITPLGSMKNIVVSGNERVTQEEIIKATQIDSRDYTLTTFLNRNQYAKNVSLTNPWIEKAEIIYQFPITFKIQVSEYKIIAYEASTGNIYPVISNGNLIQQPVKKESLPENYIRLNLTDKAKVKKFVKELTDINDLIKNNIQTVDLTPSKATKDLLTLTMRDGHKIIVPLSDIHKKLPYYSRVQAFLTEPSIVDMEAGIFSYAASLAQKEKDEQEEKTETSESEETEASSGEINSDTNNDTNIDTNTGINN